MPEWVDYHVELSYRTKDHDWVDVAWLRVLKEQSTWRMIIGRDYLLEIPEVGDPVSLVEGLEFKIEDLTGVQALQQIVNLIRR